MFKFHSCFQSSYNCLSPLSTFVMRSMTMSAHYLGFPSFVTEGPLFSFITHRLRLHFNLGRLKINSAEDKFRILRLDND